MAIMMLFGIDLAPLYDGIAAVESERGATSANVYQIRQIFVDDVNRLYPHMRFAFADVTDETKSRQMMYLYWLHYGEKYHMDTGKLPTSETLARIHNGGPDGWRKPATVGYWRRVKKAMEGAK